LGGENLRIADHALNSGIREVFNPKRKTKNKLDKRQVSASVPVKWPEIQEI
jgi:hypothetical protein